MAHSIKHSHNKLHGHKFTPIQYCITILTILSNSYNEIQNLYKHDEDEETVVGYESSWAGIANNTKFR